MDRRHSDVVQSRRSGSNDDDCGQRQLEEIRSYPLRSLLTTGVKEQEGRKDVPFWRNVKKILGWPWTFKYPDFVHLSGLCLLRMSNGFTIIGANNVFATVMIRNDQPVKNND